MKKQTTSTLFITLALLCILLPKAQAVSPPPDGGYPGGNTAEGQAALLSRTTGGFNTAAGFLSLRSDTTGQFNTAVGAGTLLSNTGDENTATGAGALLSNTTGSANTASGINALFSNTTATNNTATGFQALFSNTTGNDNTASGINALFSNTTGNMNTALGILAGINVTTASNVICIGAKVAGADVSNTTWVGNVYGVTTQSSTTAPVIVSADGQLGTVASSERFKKDIATMDRASEAILSLRPVTFHYKSDTTGIAQFGLIAEEVTKVNPALVLPDKEGKPYSVRYDAVNAMLLNEFLKEHRKVEDQQAAIAELNLIVEQQVALITQQQKGLEAITARVAEQAAQMRKVLGLIEMSQGTPQVVSNKP